MNVLKGDRKLKILLKAGFVKPVEITDCVFSMILVKKKNEKLKECVDYKKMNACTQKYHFQLPFITLLLEVVGGHGRYTFMDGYAGYNFHHLSKDPPKLIIRPSK